MVSYELIKQNASALLGKPYVWGGDSDAEGGYDCSGFVYTVLKKSGFNVGRTTAQGYYNKFSTYPRVKKTNIDGGELIFFGKSTSNITHVAIAKDLNHMWESIGSSKNTIRNKGKGVVVSDINRRTDVVAIIEIIDPIVNDYYYPKYTGKSSKLDTILCEIGAPYGNVSKRSRLALYNGINNYKGTYSQNITLIKLAKQGTLRRV